MQVVLRPYVSAGVAVLGAGLIAATPLVAPELEQRLQQRAADLVAAADPLTPYIDLVENTFANLGTLGDEIFAAPAPILSQFLTNQIDYAYTLGAGVGSALQYLVGYYTGDGTVPGGDFPDFLPALHNVVTDFQAGDIHGAVYGLYEAFLFFPTWAVLFDSYLSYAVATVTAEPTFNLAATLNTFWSDYATVLGALLVPSGSVADETGAIGQSLYDAFQAGDASAFFSTILASPAYLANALLNGSDPTGHLQGILTAGLCSPGSIEALLDLRSDIAAAITPAPQAISGVIPAVADLTAWLNSPDLATDLAAAVNPGDLAAALGPALTAIGDIPATLLSLLP